MNDQPMFREKKVKLFNPIYIIGFTWLLYGFFFPLYRLTDLLIASAVSALTFMLARRFIPERAVVQPLTEKGVLDTRCMEIIEKGNAYIGDLEKLSQRMSDQTESRRSDVDMLDGRITSQKLRHQINEIISISRQMLDYTAKNPRLALDLRNFIDYYFPVTIKLLNAHNDMRGQNVKSENVTGIIEKVHAVMGTIVPGFRKQLDLMYAEKRLDIGADIEVLKSLLTAEGLTENDGGAFK